MTSQKRRHWILASQGDSSTRCVDEVLLAVARDAAELDGEVVVWRDGGQAESAPDAIQMITSIGGRSVAAEAASFSKVYGCPWVAVVGDSAKLDAALLAGADRVCSFSPAIDDRLMEAGIESDRIVSVPWPAVEGSSRGADGGGDVIVWSEGLNDGIDIEALSQGIGVAVRPVDSKGWSRACESALAAWTPGSSHGAVWAAAQAMARGLPVVALANRASLDVFEIGRAHV